MSLSTDEGCHYSALEAWTMGIEPVVLEWVRAREIYGDWCHRSMGAIFEHLVWSETLTPAKELRQETERFKLVHQLRKVNWLIDEHLPNHKAEYEILMGVA